MSNSNHVEGISSHGKEIWVNQFDEKSAQRFRERVLEISEEDPNTAIIIHIDSYGGYVDSLAKMIETMDEVPNRFITICLGKAMSCGAILLSHGDLRFCGRYSRIMVHNVSSASWGDVYSIKSGSDEAMRLNKVFMGLLAENCGMSYDKLQEQIRAATDSKEIWMDAEQAKVFGIVDEAGLPEMQMMVQWSYNLKPKKDKIKKTKSSPKKRRRK